MIKFARYLIIHLAFASIIDAFVVESFLQWLEENIFDEPEIDNGGEGGD